MSERHMPAVGDMVRLSHWIAGDALKVTAVGRDNFLAIEYGDPHERSWNIDDDWVQVVQLEPLTETWTAVRANGLHHRLENATNFAQAAKMSQRAHGRSPVAIVHIWTDADGDHVEIERVTK
jgi:hypothetical protein